MSSRTKNGKHRVNLKFIQRVPTLVELESRLLPSGQRFNGWNVGFGLRIRVRSTRSWLDRGLLGSFRGSSEHLNYLFKRGSISLNEGSRVRIDRFGSSDGFGRMQLMQLRRRSWRHDLEAIAGAATAAAAVSHATAWRRKERRRTWVFLMN